MFCIREPHLADPAIQARSRDRRNRAEEFFPQKARRPGAEASGGYSGSETAVLSALLAVFAFLRPPARDARLRAGAFGSTAGSLVPAAAVALFLAVAFFAVGARLRPRAGFAEGGVSSAGAESAAAATPSSAGSGWDAGAAAATTGVELARVPTTPTLRMCAGGAPCRPIGPRPPPRAAIPRGAAGSGFTAGVLAVSAAAS